MDRIVGIIFNSIERNTFIETSLVITESGKIFKIQIDHSVIGPEIIVKDLGQHIPVNGAI